MEKKLETRIEREKEQFPSIWKRLDFYGGLSTASGIYLTSAGFHDNNNYTLTGGITLLLAGLTGIAWSYFRD